MQSGMLQCVGRKRAVESDDDITDDDEDDNDDIDEEDLEIAEQGVLISLHSPSLFAFNVEHGSQTIISLQ